MSTTTTAAIHILVEENYNWSSTSSCQRPPWSSPPCRPCCPQWRRPPNNMSLIRKTVCGWHGSWRWRGVGAEIVQSHPSRASQRRDHYSIQSQGTHLMINDDHHHVVIIIIIWYPECSFSSNLNSEMIGYMFSWLMIFWTLIFHVSLLAPYTLYLGSLRRESSFSVTPSYVCVGIF